jgi:hypothetical protein
MYSNLEFSSGCPNYISKVSHSNQFGIQKVNSVNSTYIVLLETMPHLNQYQTLNIGYDFQKLGNT